MTDLTVGSDPEFFLTDSSGELKSSVGLVGGSKNYPKPLERPGFFIQEDNVAVEFNIPPATNRDDFVNSILWAKDTITARVEALGLHTKFAASGRFSAKELDSDAARQFGCTPDYNAWLSGQVNPKPRADGDLRTCGGHIHLGYPNKNKIFAQYLIRACDVYAGVPSVLVDLDTERNLLYGKAGAFRYTRYGCEYRVLSNWWLQNPSWCAWAFDSVTNAYNFLMSEKEKAVKWIDDRADEVVEIINTRNIAMASSFMERNNIAHVY